MLTRAGRARRLSPIVIALLLAVTGGLALADSTQIYLRTAHHADRAIGLAQSRAVVIAPRDSGAPLAPAPLAAAPIAVTSAIPLDPPGPPPEATAPDQDPEPALPLPPPAADPPPPPPLLPEPEPAPQPTPPPPEPEPAPQPTPPPPEPEPAPQPTPPPPAPEPAPAPPSEPDPQPDQTPPPSPAPDPPPAPPTLTVGIDGHYAGWPADEVNDRTALGAPVTRHMWELDNPVSAEEPLMISAATKVHTRIHALIGGNSLGDAAHLRDFVVAFVGYWGPGGTFWNNNPQLDESSYAITSIELGNEPYFGTMTASEYADTVRPTLEALRQLEAPVKVILPTFIHGHDTSWIDTLYDRIPDLNSLIHGFADHPYWYGHHPADHGSNGPFDRIETLRERMDQHGAGEKPIYITEYGESTASCGGECVSEADQAEHLQAMLDAVVSHPEWRVALITFFQLRDRGTESPNREEQFGLLRQDGTPKPAYPILRDAMQAYRG